MKKRKTAGTKREKGRGGARLFGYYRKGLAWLALAAMLFCAIVGCCRALRFFGGADRLLAALFTGGAERTAAVLIP